MGLWIAGVPPGFLYVQKVRHLGCGANYVLKALEFKWRSLCRSERISDVQKLKGFWIAAVHGGADVQKLKALGRDWPRGSRIGLTRSMNSYSGVTVPQSV